MSIQPTKEELKDWDEQHYWHSFTPMAGYESLVIERAEGSCLYDTEGREYLDAASSMWCTVVGHNHPRVNAAITEQLGRVAHCTSLGMGADVTVKLAKRLADIAPGNLEKVFFSSDGSSAIEIAMKQAFQYWRQCDKPQPSKTKFLALDSAYHGDTIGATAVGGIERYLTAFRPLLCEVLHEAAPDVRDAPVQEHAELTQSALKRFDDLIAKHADELVAVVIEPLVQCAAGMLMHPPGFLAGLREITKRHGVLLIADEIAVGYAKTGKMFACEHENVVPDFLCIGKGLTAGYLPMAATITSAEIYDTFLNQSEAEDRTFWHGHTFSGNPLASAAALVCLDLFEEEQLLEAMKPKIARLAEHLDRLSLREEVIHPRQRGIITAFDLKQSGRSEFLDPASIGRQLAQYCLEHGVWLRPRPDMIYVMPPLSITLEEIDHMMQVIEESLDVVFQQTKQAIS